MVKYHIIKYTFTEKMNQEWEHTYLQTNWTFSEHEIQGGDNLLLQVAKKQE